MLSISEEDYTALMAKLGKGQSVNASPSVKKTNKYRAIKKVVDGYTFASSGEAKRYAELSMLQKAGKIHGLALQRRFRIEVKQLHICDYVADFTYYEGRVFVVEDFKGIRTPMYDLKKKLLFATHGLVIRETGSRR